MIRTDCARLGISVHTNTGGDLYMSQPAMDMLTLVNALVHFDEADYLYNLVTSNFFNLDIPKSNLYELRMRSELESGELRWMKRNRINYLIRYMNLMLANTVDKKFNTWETIDSEFKDTTYSASRSQSIQHLEPGNTLAMTLETALPIS